MRLPAGHFASSSARHDYRPSARPFPATALQAVFKRPRMDDVAGAAVLDPRLAESVTSRSPLGIGYLLDTLDTASDGR
jgi:hypothetical protein